MTTQTTLIVTGDVVHLNADKGFGLAESIDGLLGSGITTVYFRLNRGREIIWSEVRNEWIILADPVQPYLSSTGRRRLLPGYRGGHAGLLAWLRLHRELSGVKKI